MKKTYLKKGKSGSKNLPRKTAYVLDWAIGFLRNNSQVDSSSILHDFHNLSQQEQAKLEHFAVRILRDQRLKRDEALRSGAVRLIVALLPKTFSVLEKLLTDSSSALWYEVHFTAFSALDYRDDLSETDRSRVLALIERYLTNAKSTSGFAAWKAGDILGDEWNAPDTVQILERLLFSAKYVAGRRSALHGIAHAVGKATAAEQQRLLSLVHKVASEDRSAEVRGYALWTLKGGSCFMRKGAPGTHSA